MSLIDRVDALVQGLACNSSQILQPGRELMAVLRACQMLLHGPSAAALATALAAAFSLGRPGPCPRAGDMAAIARLFASELAAGLAAFDSGATTAVTPSVAVIPTLLPKLSGTRTVLRHRAAWMATAVLRAQLRWLLDPPPQAISASNTAPSSSSSSSSSSDYPLTGNCSSGVRSRHWSNLYRFVLLKEAVPLPVYVPPPGDSD